MRHTTLFKKHARSITNEIMHDVNLRDCYRDMTPTGGFTGQRGNIMSRLDMILVSSGKAALCTDTETDWNKFVLSCCPVVLSRTL